MIGKLPCLTTVMRSNSGFLTRIISHGDKHRHCITRYQVTCFEYADQLLPREDPDAAKCLEGALLEDGLDIRLGAYILPAADNPWSCNFCL